MTVIFVSPAADAALDRLEQEGNQALLERIEDVLDRLETDPGHHSLRRHRMQDPPVFYVTVSAGTETWVILWTQTTPDRIDVPYIGPASFA